MVSGVYADGLSGWKCQTPLAWRYVRWRKYGLKALCSLWRIYQSDVGLLQELRLMTLS